MPDFVISNADEKLNPNVIRRLLFDIVHEMFGGNLLKMARTIKSRGYLRYRKQNLAERTLTDHIKKLLDDEKRFEYWHIEIMANLIGVPAGVILIYTRIQSDYDKNDFSHPVEMTKFLHNTARKMERVNRNLNFDDLRELSEVFKGKQRELF